MNDRPSYNSSRTHPICAACKYMRRKCVVGKCPIAPYFPAENTREFQAVLKVFGVSNMVKMILGVDEANRRQLVESLVGEAFMRERDPVLGIYREYARVSNERLHFKALAHTNSVRILQLQSQITRMRGDENGNGNNSMSVPSDHVEWSYKNYPVVVAVTANETINNNPMTYATTGSESCTIHGIPFASNNQNHLQIKNDNQERAVASSATVLLPPSSMGDDLTSSILPQVHDGK